MYYITIVVYFITILTYYVSLIIYYMAIVRDHNKCYILIIIFIIYYITKTEHLYPLKHSLGTALSHSLSSVYSYFTYMIGLTKRSHVSPKMQYVTFCDSIVRFDWCRTKRIDSVCGVTRVPQCAIDGSVITCGRGEGEPLSHHAVSTQCAEDLTQHIWVIFFFQHKQQCQTENQLPQVHSSYHATH